MYKLIASSLLAVSMAGSADAAVNLVTNGGFESVAAGTPAAGFEVGNYIYGQAVTGWTSAAGSTTNANNAYNVLYNSATATTVNPHTRYSGSETQTLAHENYGGASPDGGNFMALDGDTLANGAFSQTINGLTVGSAYRLTFYWAATQFQNRVGDTTERLDVSFGNDSFSTATVANPTHGWQGWFTVTHDFTATSASQVLSFLSIGTPNGLPPVALLDGVSLTAVPEPATWGLMLAGFGALGVAARRRRRMGAVHA